MANLVYTIWNLDWIPAFLDPNLPRDVLDDDHVSRVSNADRSMDCRKYAALSWYVRSLIDRLKTLTFRQDTTVLSSRNRCRGIPWVACSCVIVQTISDLLYVIIDMKNRTDIDVLPVLHRQ